MDTDVSLDELEKQELELLRKFASACKQHEFGEAEIEVKRSLVNSKASKRCWLQNVRN